MSLVVRGGTIFGFIGPNGAGKTTLIRSIVGASTMTSGDIRVCGMSVREQPVACKRLMAYVPDNPDVYGFLTGAQYLAHIADVFGVPREQRQRRIERYAQTFRIEGRLDELVSSYSHGMRQKLVLVSAFLHAPRLLVLDEPFVGLDPQASMSSRPSCASSPSPAAPSSSQATCSRWSSGSATRSPSYGRGASCDARHRGGLRRRQPRGRVPGAC